MATNDKGSDLDVFEDLSKGAGSGSPAGGESSVPPPPPRRSEGAPRTLLGVTAPPSSPASASGPRPAANTTRPPPPPGRTALPPVAPASKPAASPAAKASGVPGVDVDWDDEDEATHIFDKGNDPLPRVNAAPAPAAGAPHPGASMKSTLLGLTPPPHANRSAPPPAHGGSFGRASGLHSAGTPSSLPPPAIGTLPPPAPTLQGLGVTTQTRPIPPPPGPPLSSPPMGLPSTTMPPARLGASGRPSTEVTALLRPPSNPAALWVVFGLVAALIVGAVLLLMPHTGRVVINVTDPRGSSVGRLDIFLDGRRQCDTAPCIVEQVSAGSHEVKVIADGYETPAIQEVVVESRKDSIAALTLGGGSKRTGIKVSGTQAGAKLYVDDKEVGPLPQDYRELSPGDHVVRIVGSERYQPLERRITLEKDRTEDLGTVTLKVLKGKATISLTTPGARVFLASGADRRELPMLPISVDIDTTKAWSLQASRLGYGDYNQPISFDDGQAEKTFVVSLEPKPAPVGGNFWAQQAPPPATNPAPAPATQNQAAAPNPTPAVAAQPAVAAGEGFLNINSIPPSTCFLDGKPLGLTPKVHISVAPGPHQVKFVNAEQQLTKMISVTVGAGETKLAVAKLSN
jgi:hypothetical protein